MKAPAKYLLLLLLVTAATACKKQDEYPKVYPGSYFPAYPGSWWKYRIIRPGSLDSVTWTTSADYQPDRYLTGVNTYSDYSLVPFIFGEAIYGYNKVHCMESAGPCFLSPFLSETPGASWDWPGITKYNMGYTRWRVISKGVDTQNDSVLVIKGAQKAPSGQNAIKYVTWIIYKKNVGMILSCDIDTTVNDTVLKQYLTTFHISFRK
jgi:hypothetical protein